MRKLHFSWWNLPKDWILLSRRVSTSIVFVRDCLTETKAVTNLKSLVQPFAFNDCPTARLTALFKKS